jgi:hypothetical protein
MASFSSRAAVSRPWGILAACAGHYNVAMNTTCLAVLCAVALAAPVRVPSARGEVSIERTRQDTPADVAGAWALTVETGQGTGTPSVTFKQDGEKLTGAYSSQVFGEQKVTGTIKGNAITFSFTGSVEGNSMTVTYAGTVEKDTMKGKVTLGDLGEGTFTGKKK